VPRLSRLSNLAPPATGDCVSYQGVAPYRRWCHSSIPYHDYSSVAWPVFAAVDRWFWAPGTQAPYVTSGAGDVWVYSGNYGSSFGQGLTTMPYSGNCLLSGNGRIKLNDWWPIFTDNVLNHRRVATHEVGHSLGLNHPTGCNRAMYPYTGGCQGDGLSACDRQGIAYLY
jgi:hypothetical protein